MTYRNYVEGKSIKNSKMNSAEEDFTKIDECKMRERTSEMTKGITSLGVLASVALG